MLKNLNGRVATLLMVLLYSTVGLGQIDADASENTKTLYQNLRIIQNSNYFLFGQEFFNSFKFSSANAHNDETYSDCHQVTGAYPVVLGSDFHYYLEKSATERQYHTEAVKWAYRQGFVITFDWHLSGKGTSTYQYTETTKNLVNSIVTDPQGEDREWFIAELDKVIAIINYDLVVDEERIPIVFRPFHEMNGGWFWWGTQATTADQYKALFALTVEYIKERTNSVLFCWSPNIPTNFSYYPGDDYVDVLGLDAYEITAAAFRYNMALIVDHAQAHNKVAVFSETGYRNDTGNGDTAAKYWRDTVLPAILNDPGGKAIKIAWVLTWINASWSEPYVPHSASTAMAKQSFIDFKNSNHVKFSDEIQNLYEPLIVSSTGETSSTLAIQLYPVPASGRLKIILSGFASPTSLTIIGQTGVVVFKAEMTEAELVIENLHSPGLYVVRASDGQRTVCKKFVVE
jgi:mannan endo-1,4-beta-mannosidase